MSESQPGQPLATSSPLPAPAFANADADASAPSRIADAPFALSQDPVTEQGPAPALPAGTVPAPAYEHLGELPASYGTQSVYLVAYDPRQLFVYWDIDWKRAPGAAYALRVYRGDGQLETRLDIASSDAGRYVETELPGGTYRVELGQHGRDGSWQGLASSNTVTMPPPGLSGDLAPQFATLPFHLSFQRLLELIHNAMGHGEELTAALSRLQQGGEPAVSPLLGTLHRLTGDQLHTLEMLLGQKFEIASDTSSSGGGVPGGAASVLRDRHEALSSGAFGSENLSSGAFGSENLSSGALGSETLSSGGVPGIHRETLSSGGALGMGSEVLSSGGAMGGETLSSGGAFGLGSETLSSGALTGLGSETLSSGAFGSETLSAGGALGSETLAGPLAMGSEWLSSGAFGSEALSSFMAPGPSSEVWRLAGKIGPGGGSDTMDSESAAVFLHAVEKNLDVLSSMFSAFGSEQGGGASDGFSAGGW